MKNEINKTKLKKKEAPSEFHDFPFKQRKREREIERKKADKFLSIGRF